MRHLNNIYGDKTELNYNSVVINESEDCKIRHHENDIQNWAKYLLKVGAVSALSFSICNISPNFHYSEAITSQQMNKIGISDYLLNVPILDEIDVDHEIAFASTELENLNPILPKKSIKVKGRIIRINKGSISSV